MEDEYCVVYSVDDSFTSWVQAILAFIGLLSLYLKRHFERPKRTFMTWFLDTSKQGIGAVYAHVSNMAIAALIADVSWGDYELLDECAWYAISFLVDTSIGLIFSLLLLGILNGEAKKRGWKTLEHNGAYDGQELDRYKIWSHQVLAWIVILTIVRGLNLIFIWAFSPFLARAGDLLFGPIQEDIRFELLFVMIIFPGILNLFYFWIADHHLKADGSNPHSHEQPEENSSYLSAEDYDAHQIPSSFTSSLSFELPNIPLERVRTMV
jgi:hypothetical protein